MMSSSRHDNDGTPDVYRRLGLLRCINASGHVTALGGSLQPGEARAVAQALRCVLVNDSRDHDP